MFGGRFEVEILVGLLEGIKRVKANYSSINEVKAKEVKCYTRVIDTSLVPYAWS